MKYYYVFNGVPKIEDRTHPPSETYCRVPEALMNEEAEWLEVIDDTDIDGNPIKVLQVNDTIKADKLADKAAKKSSDDADKAAKDLKKAALKALKSSDIKNINDAAQAIIDIIERLEG